VIDAGWASVGFLLRGLFAIGHIEEQGGTRVASEFSALRAGPMTAAAMTAFAANSLLCRIALGAREIDAASFTSIRALSGAVILSIFLLARRSGFGDRKTDFRAVAALFAYMIFFSFAYITLAAGTGALILFGAVQLTMFAAALRQGERFSPLAWAGLALAIGGLVYLVSPGLAAPDPLGAGLMAVAGIAWGFYSLIGRGVTDPLAATARSFIFSVPLALLVSLAFWSEMTMSTRGLILAVLSGAVASGCGYVIWYAALPALTAGRAATVQLSVPVIAAIGGVLLLSEEASLRLVLASVMTLGGVFIVLSRRN